LSFVEWIQGVDEGRHPLARDWYESMYHLLVRLFPRLSVGGVLIVNDYGHWKGSQKAIDQYIEENHLKLQLS
jgi:O-methyltransferase